MVISFSLALLFGVIMFFMIRGGVIKWGPAIVAILFGFSLASTGANDPIEDFLQGVTDAVDDVDDSINDRDDTGAE
ncbi:hypothetical protein [Streptomyces litchfieldiae]|uniref:Integral membrane protein n=1 Tax=Streptomyces litchfieldiae TaxID=3075543 RepID=A0ABU2MMU0_9ACTN|nr:hypothetical protein [Streptomyces sp. DSM 44938]MDT0342766.1 hypothetical protein [Streptomyces sp. DSM 44938]